jgi:hypothetical protein
VGFVAAGAALAFSCDGVFDGPISRYADISHRTSCE